MVVVGVAPVEVLVTGEAVVDVDGGIVVDVEVASAEVVGVLADLLLAEQATTASKAAKIMTVSVGRRLDSAVQVLTLGMDGCSWVGMRSDSHGDTS